MVMNTSLLPTNKFKQTLALSKTNSEDGTLLVSKVVSLMDLDIETRSTIRLQVSKANIPNKFTATTDQINKN